jgi:ubiquinol-cytochrome c reductase cytochrome c subunit
VSIQGNRTFRDLKRCSNPFSVVRVAMSLMFLLMTLQAQGQSAKASSTSDVGKIEHGKLIYNTSGCYECHGRVGQGSRFSGARIAPPPVDSSAFIQYVRQPAGQMPPYTSRVLSDAELLDIFAFLKSMPVPPAAKDIPLLK